MSSASSSDSSSPPSRVKRKRIFEEEEEEDDDDVVQNTEAALDPEDTVALSHAERRRQKKKDKKGQEEPSKKRKLVDDTATEVSSKDAKPTGKGKPKRQNSVWVGNLWYKTTPDALRDFFDGVGEITRIHMPTKKGTKEIMGFAYVDFATPDAKVTAIALSERELHGRNLLIKDGGDFAGRPTSTAGERTSDVSKDPATGKLAGSLTKTQQKILRVQKQPPAPTLFLGNLGFETTEDSIRELFEAHRYPQKTGKGLDLDDAKVNIEEGNAKDNWIRKIRMGTFEDSGACKGFAFVDFTSIEHATTALINHRNHRLNGRDLVVEYASADAVRRGGGPRVQNHEHNRRHREMGTGRQHDAELQSRSHLRERNECRREHRAKRNDAESLPQRNFKEASSYTKTHRPQSRPKPGAALAQAQRGSAAIIPSQGQKIVF